MSKPMSFAEAQELFEKYWNRAKELDYVIDKVAWALYQTWKEADRRSKVWIREAKRNEFV